jgi:hypothetical protein
MQIRTINTSNQILTTEEPCSVQVVFHGARRMPHTPKVHDHQLLPCNLAFQ